MPQPVALYATLRRLTGPAYYNAGIITVPWHISRMEIPRIVGHDDTKIRRSAGLPCTAMPCALRTRGCRCGFVGTQGVNPRQPLIDTLDLRAFLGVEGYVDRSGSSVIPDSLSVGLIAGVEEF